MQILTRKSQVTTLHEVKIISVRDSFKDKKITAKIEGLDRSVFLWNGEEEYAQAGIWTDESALERAKEILALPEIPWASY